MALLKNTLIGHTQNWNTLFDLLKKNLLAHSYLLVGPPGIGKKQFAMSFIQAAMCENMGCGICSNCLKIEKNQHESILYIEPEGTQIKVQQAHEVHQFLNLQSTSPKRFIILNEAHMMTPQSANSLLKIIEEPPKGTHFFLISPSEKSVLKTLKSRSQVIRFSPLKKDEILEHQNVPEWILNAAGGRMDVIQSLQAPELSALRTSVFDILMKIDPLNLKQTFSDIKDLLKNKEQALQVLLYFQQALRDALFLKNDLHPIIHADQEALLKQYKSIPQEKLFELFEASKQLEKDIHGNIDRSLSFENLSLKLCQ